MNVFLVIDIGTGNVRAAFVNRKGKVIGIERDTVHYIKDDLYTDALYFEPAKLWLQIDALVKKLMIAHPGYHVQAVTSSSQREGVVLIDRSGKSIIGFPNHDHRGREWEHEIAGKDEIYHQTGRYPGSLFSAMKVLAIKKRQPEVFDEVDCIMSISDWAGYQLTGTTGYEHSQASETQLYDIEKKDWSDSLCKAFSINRGLLPPPHESGTIAGTIIPKYAREWGIGEKPFVVGGADTQLAVQSTQPLPGDIVIVSGTTTPVVKIIDKYITDKQQRTWTNRHTVSDYFILETNAGVTGLNLQRFKEGFYPNEDYDIMEAELLKVSGYRSVASLGSLIAGQPAITRGGFVFDVPLAHQLSRADFMHAIIWDIVNCITINLDILTRISPSDQDYVWACGGGFQGKLLLQYLSTLSGKKIRLRDDFQHASVVGGAFACNAALGNNIPGATNYETITPGKTLSLPHPDQWQEVRNHFLHEKTIA